MPQVKLTLCPTEADWQLIQQAKGSQALAGFLLSCVQRAIAQEIYLTHHAPDKDQRNKDAIFRCLANGQHAVADIGETLYALSDVEIEGYLFELEQEGRIHRLPGKRGQMWRWDVGPEGKRGA